METFAALRRAKIDFSLRKFKDWNVSLVFASTIRYYVEFEGKLAKMSAQIVLMIKFDLDPLSSNLGKFWFVSVTYLELPYNVR